MACDNAKHLLRPVVEHGKKLYLLKNGRQIDSLSIKAKTEYGFSDWQTYSAILSKKPGVKILTNNPTVGLSPLVTQTNNHISLAKRIDPEGEKLSDKLLGEVDFDNDQIAEKIFLSQDYEGVFYQIFSYKNGKWDVVYVGGYQGL